MGWSRYFILTVAPQLGETVILKNHTNSFRDTQLKQVLDEQGIDEVVIVGAMSHMCIGATARAAIMHHDRAGRLRDDGSGVRRRQSSGGAGSRSEHGGTGVRAWRSRGDERASLPLISDGTGQRLRRWPGWHRRAEHLEYLMAAC